MAVNRLGMTMILWSPAFYRKIENVSVEPSSGKISCETKLKIEAT